MPDKKHLTRRHGRANEATGTWYAVLSVPQKLQPSIGKRHLLKSLQTTDLTIARSRRRAALAEFEAILNRARQQTGATSVMDAAMSWRETVNRFSSGDLSGFWVHPPPPPGTDMRSLALTLARDDIEESADQVAGTHSPAVAAAFLGVATGTATPLRHHVDSWLREGGRKGPLGERTKSQYGSFVSQFADWCRHAGVPATVEAVTKPVAGRFITEEFVAKGIDTRTSNAHISALSAFWRWMSKRAGIEHNPWTGQSRAKASARHGERNKRAFTDQEIVTLLNGNAGQELADLIRVAALTGMRLSEICALTVADCADSLFDIRQAKTVAGVRRVPVHSDLTAIVSRRTEGKAPTVRLFPTASNNLSQRFTAYRRVLGIDDRREGRRHSRIDFHSLRRWFVTQARNAGYDRGFVAFLVGHETGFITDDVYSGGPTMERCRQCVDAVRLPVTGC
jgi:integrase